MKTKHEMAEELVDYMTASEVNKRYAKGQFNMPFPWDIMLNNLLKIIDNKEKKMEKPKLEVGEGRYARVHAPGDPHHGKLVMVTELLKNDNDIVNAARVTVKVNDIDRSLTYYIDALKAHEYLSPVDKAKREPKPIRADDKVVIKERAHFYYNCLGTVKSTDGTLATVAIDGSDDNAHTRMLVKSLSRYKAGEKITLAKTIENKEAAWLAWANGLAAPHPDTLVQIRYTGGHQTGNVRAGIVDWKTVAYYKIISNAKEQADPYGKSPQDAGSKLDLGKAPVRTGLLEYFPRACMAVANVSAYGAKKYTWNGWETVPDGARRYGDAEVRHICEQAISGKPDIESGLEHAAHEAWNALARLEILLRGKNNG